MQTVVAIFSAFCLMVFLQIWLCRLCVPVFDNCFDLFSALLLGLPVFQYLYSSRSMQKMVFKITLLCSSVGFLFGYFDFMTEICLLVMFVPLTALLIQFNHLLSRYFNYRRELTLRLLEQYSQ